MSGCNAVRTAAGLPVAPFVEGCAEGSVGTTVDAGDAEGLDGGVDEPTSDSGEDPAPISDERDDEGNPNPMSGASGEAPPAIEPAEPLSPRAFWGALQTETSEATRVSRRSRSNAF